MDHGSRCSCRLLADAMHCHPRTVSFAFCNAVLRAHWHIECNHGCLSTESSESLPSPEKWSAVGNLDGVRAILIRNG